MSVRLAVFASGGGTNFQSIIDHFRTDDAATVAVVISDRSDAGAFQRASRAGVATSHVPVRDRDASDVARATLDVLREHDVDIIALAGYLRLVPAPVIAAFRDRIVNIHPALLPAFGGAGMYGRRVHEAVLEAGCTVSGATVHLVDERYDEGRILAQWPVPVLPDDSAESLAQRVLTVEHRLYPVVLSTLARRMAGDGSTQSRQGATGRTAAFRIVQSLDGIEAEINALMRL